MHLLNVHSKYLYLYPLVSRPQDRLLLRAICVVAHSSSLGAQPQGFANSKAGLNPSATN